MLPLLFERQGVHGLVLAFALPSADDPERLANLVALLHEAERSPLARFAPRRQMTYAGGRYAMREALRRMQVAEGPILSNDRGAPLMPASVRGSISHKDEVAAALVSSDMTAYFGVDIESVPGPSDELAPRILTGRELAQVRGLPDAQRALQLAVRFSAKESIYKALDPYVRRYVAHEEVEVMPLPDGRCEVWSNVFPTGQLVTLTWLRHGDWVITTARIGA
jgi:phosphopantetheine--protein transferase-like protein